ncbi:HYPERSENSITIVE TO PI STARVATION 4 isoform X2 [Wolffia australiana]
MTLSPAMFLLAFLAISILCWVAVMLLVRFLSRKLRASIQFRGSGCNCIRDLTMKFNKDWLESISAGKMKISLRKSLVKLGYSFISRDPKLHLSISDLEIVLKIPDKKKKGKNSVPQKLRSAGRRTWLRGTWMFITNLIKLRIANLARFFSVSVTDIVVRTPRATIDVKDLLLDMSKIGNSSSVLHIKLHLLPILIYVCDERSSFDQSSYYHQSGYLPAGHQLDGKAPAPFICEKLSIVCELGHERAVGLNVRNVDVISGEIVMNLDESLLVKSRVTSHTSNHKDSSDSSRSISLLGEGPQKDEGTSSFRKNLKRWAPDKVSFDLPKLDVRFVHRGHQIFVENNVMGIRLQSTRIHSLEESDDASPHFDVLLDFSEIYLLQEGRTPLLEVLKLAVMASFDVPMQKGSPIRAEIDIKLGGTQFNILMNKLTQWLQLHYSKKKNPNSPEIGHSERVQRVQRKVITWTCTVSAPEMAIMLYGFDSLLLYHGCSQSSHLFANNIACKGISLHAELGEIHIQRADEYQECIKENVFGVETNSGSLMHITRVSFDWGQKDIQPQEDTDHQHGALTFSGDISGMSIFFNLQHVELLLSTALSLRSLFKSLSGSKKISPKRSREKGGGVQVLKLNLERCFINFSGDILIEDASIPDPKRVNFGSHGGSVIFTVSPDGVPRSATIMSMVPNHHLPLRYLVSLEISHLSSSMDKGKKSLQMEIQRTRAIYEELSGEDQVNIKVTLFDMKNAKLVRRTGGFNEISVCSLFSASDINMRWEPDAHLVLYEQFLRLKLTVNDLKSKSALNAKEVSVDQCQATRSHKARESVFAIDVDKLRLSAELADGVEAMLHVQSIFSENAKIGMLLEGLNLSFNEGKVLKSSRIQISRIPVSVASGHDPGPLLMASWDWVIQGLDVQFCMPYRLPLRAIEDAVEDMLRALKLINSARNRLLTPPKNDTIKKTTTKSNFRCVKLNIKKITADIEEEPIQGWLDEHYHLMKDVICESAVRMKFFDDISSDSNTLSLERKIEYDGITIDTNDLGEIKKLKDEIYKKSFRSYYLACQKLSLSEGSGACRSGFQAGFQPSTARKSLLCLSVSDLDLTLKKVEGSDEGMVQFINSVDPVSSECDVPFSRFYGGRIILRTSSIIIQLRNYSFPLFSGYSGKCEGTVVLAQQATCFQPQVHQDVFVGRWWRVRMLRSASGTTPPLKMYADLPIFFEKGQVSFGVGYEPAFADISYAFTVALRRTNLSVKHRSSVSTEIQPIKKERSLPWWDDMRYYIHGKINLCFNETEWNLLATTNPYEKIDKLQIASGFMEIQQRDGHLVFSADDFKIFQTSLHSLTTNCSLKAPPGSRVFIASPTFCLEVDMDWDCASGKPLNHYLHALPAEGEPREKVYDPFRSVSLSLRWNFLLQPSQHHSQNVKDESCQGRDLDHVTTCPAMYLGAHDLVWLFKWWNLNYSPPHKLRSFSRWPRFGIPRVARSGNLSLDKVMTELFLRLDSTPTLIKHMPLCDDDPANELTFEMTKLKYELCYSRGKHHYTFDCTRDTLDLIYQGLDLHWLRAYLNRYHDSGTQESHSSKKFQCKVRRKSGQLGSDTEKQGGEGFLLSSDYFTIRKQAPKADSARLLSWQNVGRRNHGISTAKSESDNGSETDGMRSEPSDDDGYNVVVADNCQRIFIYGLKLLWTIENRDAVWSWFGGMSKAFEPPKPSPSRQYAARKLMEQNMISERVHVPRDVQTSSQSKIQNISTQSPPHSQDQEIGDLYSEGTRHFMVNVIQPQFNLQSEDANGRFLLAAASGRLLARSIDSLVQVGSEIIQKLSDGNLHIQEEHKPQMVWKRVEYSAMLEHVQAHVAPTDVDPGAGLQWLPKILGSSPKVKRTGALLERVFMPCTMYFRYTRHKGATSDLKVKPLKELSFNSANITATMTSRQFQVMLDILSNLLFARLPKPRKSSLLYPAEDDDVEEEADEVVPDGVEEVELAKVILEQRERERKLILDDIRTLSTSDERFEEASSSLKKDDMAWMIRGGKFLLVQRLRTEFTNVQKSRKAAAIALRMALQKAALLRLTEKEKSKSPSCAMRISMKIDKVVWSMLADGKAFAEAEIINMMYDFDRDYKDIGVAQFITKSFSVKNCLPNAKSDMLLSAWNAPELGSHVMLRVDARQGAPKDGISSLELFQVEIYPLKIHLTETMYRMMWGYFFPEEEQDSHRRQEVWKVSTTASSRRTKKISSTSDTLVLATQPSREVESSCARLGSNFPSSAANVENSQISKLQSVKGNVISGSSSELRKTPSFDESLEGNLCDNDKGGLPSPPPDQQTNDNDNETAKSKSKESKSVKSGRSPHEEKKVGKSQDDKRARGRKLMEFHNIKISQVELHVTYEGSRFAVNDLRLLMDTFHRDAFTGTWRRLFSRVKKHIIWGVLKSVTGMQGKKFKQKAQGQKEEGIVAGVPDSDLNLSDSDGGLPGKLVQFPMTMLKRASDGAGEGFVTSIRGLFNSQRRRAKEFVRRTMRGEADPDLDEELSESDDVEAAPFARQLTISKAKMLMRRHRKKFRARGQKASGSTSQQRESIPSFSKDTTPFESDFSSDSTYEDVYG